MSRPPLNPDKTIAGIAVDPQTLERVIPESRRPDGTVRKQIKIRPGFTPQEDIKRFRGTKQAQLDANALPKGHIIGWAPPPTSTPPSTSKPLSKSAKKNAKRKEKREEKKVNVPDNWEDDEESEKVDSADQSVKQNGTATNAADQKTSESKAQDLEAPLISQMENLKVKDSTQHS